MGRYGEQFLIRRKHYCNRHLKSKDAEDDEEGAADENDVTDRSK